MNPTAEQQYAIDKASQERQNDLKIEAFADAGKTTTLKGIADVRGGTGLYLAFNRALGRTAPVSEEAADVVLSTAHKSKGREWANVKLANDFQAPGEKGGDEEANLLYVAVTRAREILDVTECEAYNAAKEAKR